MGIGDFFDFFADLLEGGEDSPWATVLGAVVGFKVVGILLGLDVGDMVGVLMGDIVGLLLGVMG